MALVTTSGSASADSYASQAEATAYLAIRTTGTTWTSLASDVMDNYLRWAAIVLDTLGWRGYRTEETQALAWPRADIYDQDGYAVDDDAIPTWLKRAQAEMAYQLVSNDWTQGQGPTYARRVKLGSLEVEGEMHKKIPSAVLALCRPYLASIPGVIVPLVRG
jgi:hypothetical protein